MQKYSKAIAYSLLAMQLAMPVLVLAQIPDLDDSGDISDICGVVDLIKRIARVLLLALVLLAVIFVIMAAFKYLTAGGDSEKVSKANQQILYAAIAVAVGLLATAVPRVVAYFLGADVSSCDQVIAP